MAKSGRCPLCGKYTNLTKHHVYKTCVWRNKPETQSHIFYVCRSCHDEIEKEILKRENIVLQKHPEIYTGVVNDFLTGKVKINGEKNVKVNYENVEMTLSKMNLNQLRLMKMLVENELERRKFYEKRTI